LGGEASCKEIIQRVATKGNRLFLLPPLTCTFSADALDLAHRTCTDVAEFGAISTNNTSEPDPR
jgi:hypothetical protein